MVPDIQYGIQQSEQALNTALQQLTTSKRVNQLSDDPAASASMVLSLNASARVDRYTSNASAVNSRMQTADTALNSVVTSLTQAITLGTEGANGTLSIANRQAIAAQLQGVLGNVIAQANVSYQGTYLFGGSSTTTPPFIQAATTVTSSRGTVASPLALTTALTTGSTTTIQDAATGQSLVFHAAAGDTIGTLQTAIASAVTAGTLSAGTTASINANGNLSIGPNTASTGLVATSNEPALGAMNAGPGTEIAGQYLYTGNSTVNSVQVGDTTNVKINIPGNQLFTQGANVIGTLQNLINTLQNGTTTTIGAAASALNAAVDYVDQQRAPLGSTMNQLNSQENYLSQESLSLKTQQSSLVGVDISKAATDLSQAEVIHSATLAAAAKILPQTLLDFLR